MSVIDGALRFSQWSTVLTHDQILNEMIRQLAARLVMGKDVAALLNIAPARVTEMRKGERQIQPREMAPLAKLLGLADTEAGTEHLQTNAAIVPMEGASLEEPDENLPVVGTGLGAAREVDGEAIEQTMLNSGDVIEYVARPAILKRKQVAYALYVQGSSMHPALPDGEMAVACKDMPLKAGDNVVVYLRTANPEMDDGMTARAVLVKEMVRRTARYVELRQYQPFKEFRIDMGEILRLDRILTRHEMLQTR
ncbi:S24 family peptidase [Sphingomonas abietis]|uniref:Peptidase S24/S26A/S26B/S26C domain-containing protein n=1 Tax=Sphingomonas abietis TaxID=3012344 RepID=A0ABY7NT47_9SPHN|nr:S24 family peptidase [Sphingomonas abietis]WBO23970.1 hypothetical protein PBT88_07625 [Sphingomonas abietis]